MQGVSINIFVKKHEDSSDKKLAEVHHLDLYGKRNVKYDYLEKNLFADFQKLSPVEPYYFFVPKDFGGQEGYEEGFKVDKIFHIHSSGIETAKDSTIIQFNKTAIEKVLLDFQKKEIIDLSNEYSLDKEKVLQVVGDLKRNKFQISEILYRPFDVRNTIYTDMSQGVLWRPRSEVMRHFINKENIGFIAKR